MSEGCGGNSPVLFTSINVTCTIALVQANVCNPNVEMTIYIDIFLFDRDFITQLSDN